MNDSLFVSLDRLLLEFVFQYEQDISTKEDMIHRINRIMILKIGAKWQNKLHIVFQDYAEKLSKENTIINFLIVQKESFDDIKQNKATICKIQETINTTDEDIGYYCKHSKEIKDNCSNWKPTCDVFLKHEHYMQDQFTIYQETIEKDKKMYHSYICQYKDVLKQYRLKYSETPLSREYYEKKREHEEIQKRVLACTEQLKMNETIFMEFLVPAPFSSLIKWTLHVINLRHKTKDILRHANNFSKISSELKKEIGEMEIEINYLNQQIGRLYETKNLSETLEENTESTEKRKELEERIFEKDEQHVLVLNKTSQKSQLLLSNEYQKLVRPINVLSSEPRVTDKKEDSFVKQSKLPNVDFKQKENNVQVSNDSGMNIHSKCSHVTAIKSSQNSMQFRLLTPQQQSHFSQWFDKGDTDTECGDKGTAGQLKESKCTSQVIYEEHFGKPIDNNNEVEERAKNFSRTPEIPLFSRTPEAVTIPLFSRTPEAVKTPESLEKLLFSKTPPSEITRNIAPEDQIQKESPGTSFLMSFTSRSPGLNLFDSSIFNSEISSDKFNEHGSAENLNPLSSQKEVGNLFGKPEGEDAFTFSFSSDSSTHTFGAGKDDFSFSFSFEQDQNPTPSSVKGFSSSSQNTTQFTFF